jgi:2-methylcitrate dehydratase PrpD
MALTFAQHGSARPGPKDDPWSNHRGCVSVAAVADFQGALCDVFACALEARAAGDVMSVARACRGGGTVPIWWRAAGGDAAGAAFANAYASHRLDHDSFHPTTLGHPAAVVLPAALAAWSSAGAAGAVVVEAYVAGVETMAALALAAGSDLRRAGAHPTVAIGTYGAAAAVGVVLGLSSEQVHAAFDLCAALAPVGPRAAFGTRRKPLQVANASLVGLRAAALAAAGLADVGASWARELTGSGAHARKAVDLPMPHGLLDRAPSIFKELPLCGLLLPTVDGLLRTGLTVSPGQLGSAEITVPPSVVEASRGPLPCSVDEARFSLQFAVLAALTGSLRAEAYRSEDAFSATLEAFLTHRLFDRLKIRVGAEEPYASIRVVTAGGQVVEERWPLWPMASPCGASLGRAKLLREGQRLGLPTAHLDELVALVDEFPAVTAEELAATLRRLGEGLHP